MAEDDVSGVYVECVARRRAVRTFRTRMKRWAASKGEIIKLSVTMSQKPTTPCVTDIIAGGSLVGTGGVRKLYGLEAQGSGREREIWRSKNLRDLRSGGAVVANKPRGSDQLRGLEVWECGHCRQTQGPGMLGRDQPLCERPITTGGLNKGGRAVVLIVADRGSRRGWETEVETEVVMS
jgi:hypothetical protein